jgi:hypothetical protein
MEHKPAWDGTVASSTAEQGTRKRPAKKYGYGYNTADSIGVFRQGVEWPFDVGDVGEVMKRTTGRA